MNYSVVIPSLYEVDKDYLRLCVESLRASGFGGQIIVVTNGASSKPVLDFKGVSVHLHTKQQGQCNATNIGAQLAQSEYIMVSNSDMFYARGWDRFLRFEHLVFSPNLVEPVNNAGSAPPFLKFDGGLTIEEFDKLNVTDFINDIETDGAREMAEGFKPEEPGFNLPFFIKRDFWNFLGGYDVVWDPWGSNSDTCLQTRINLAGVIPMRLRDVLVYHFSNKTPTFAPENQAFYQHNIAYFKEKFGFDRDELNSDVWMNKDMIPENKSKIKYRQEPWTSTK